MNNFCVPLRDNGPAGVRHSGTSNPSTVKLYVLSSIFDGPLSNRSSALITNVEIVGLTTSKGTPRILLPSRTRPWGKLPAITEKNNCLLMASLTRGKNNSIFLLS